MISPNYREYCRVLSFCFDCRLLKFRLRFHFSLLYSRLVWGGGGLRRGLDVGAEDEGFLGLDVDNHLLVHVHGSHYSTELLVGYSAISVSVCVEYGLIYYLLQLRVFQVVPYHHFQHLQIKATPLKCRTLNHRKITHAIQALCPSSFVFIIIL